LGFIQMKKVLFILSFLLVCSSVFSQNTYGVQWIHDNVQSSVPAGGDGTVSISGDYGAVGSNWNLTGVWSFTWSFYAQEAGTITIAVDDWKTNDTWQVSTSGEGTFNCAKAQKFDFTVTVNDDTNDHHGGTCCLRTFTVTNGADIPPVIVGDPPVIVSNGLRHSTLGVNFLYEIIAFPTENLTYFCDNLPVFLTCDPVTGRISGLLNQQGTFSITMKATNQFGTGTKVLTLYIDDDLNNDEWFTDEKSGLEDGNGVDNDDDVPAINDMKRQVVSQLETSNETTQRIYESLEALRAQTGQGTSAIVDSINNLGNNLGGKLDGIKGVLDQQLNVQNSMKDLLQAIKDKICEPAAADPENPEAKEFSSTLTVPDVTLPEFPDNTQHQAPLFNFDWLKNLLQPHDGTEPIILTIYASKLSSQLDDIIVNFSEPPISEWVYMLRCGIQVILYIVGAFWWVRVIRSFEF